MRRVLFLSCAVLALFATSCSSDSDGATPSTTSAASGSTTTVADDGGAAAACDPYLTILGLATSGEDISTGSNDGQLAADDAWQAALDDLRAAAPDDDDAQDALDVLGELTFQVTESPTGPSEADIADAFDTLDATFGADCAGETGECPAPETLEAEGLTCDEDGNLTPIDPGQTTEPVDPSQTTAPTDTTVPTDSTAPADTEPTDGTETTVPGTDPDPGDEGTDAAGDEGGVIGPLEECPAPEVLEAEGYTCDSEGYLTPIG